MDYWTEKAHARQIRELQVDVAAAHASATKARRQLRSEVSHLRGSIEERLNRVSATLDAFVELSDLRMDLALHTDAARVRQRVLQLLEGLPAPESALPDVPGYWLAPAAEGLAALLEGDPARARERFDEADRRDALRARTFAALATVLTDPGEARALGAARVGELLPHLPVPDHEVTRSERVLWVLAAEGAFGEDTRTALRMSTVAHWKELGAEQPAPALLDQSAARRGGNSAAKGASALVVRRSRAARALSDLRERVDRLGSLGNLALPEDAVDPHGPDAESAREALRLLVEEGSAEEAPLLARAVELRQVVELSGDAGPPPARWDDPVGTVEALAAEDVSDEEAPVHRRGFALALQSEGVVRRAEELRDRVGEPVPDEGNVSVAGVRVAFTSAGPNAGDMRRARDRLQERAEDDGGQTPLLTFAVVSGVVALLLLLTAAGTTQDGAGLWILAILAGGAAVTLGVAHANRGTTDPAMVDAQMRRVRSRAEEASKVWARQLRESGELVERAGEDAAAVRETVSRI